MRNIKEILEEWDKDSVIDRTQIDVESVSNCVLHSKYLKCFINLKSAYIEAESALKNLKHYKYLYYRGEMTKPQLEELGWSQYLGKISTKTATSELVDHDIDVLELERKVEKIKIMILTVESILKSIASRSFDIKNHIEYVKFMSGG